MESSEIPPKGERAAACIWNNEALTKSLDVVPRALFSRHHQCLASPSGGWTLASLPSARHTLTRTGGRRRWPATGVGELFGLWVIPSSRCWQTTEREIAATSAPRWRPPSSFRCENFRFCDRVARRGSIHRANCTACGPTGQGVGMLYQRASTPRTVVLALIRKSYLNFLVHGVVRNFFTAPSGRARRRTAQGLVTARIVCREQRGTLARNQSKTKSTDSPRLEVSSSRFVPF